MNATISPSTKAALIKVLLIAATLAMIEFGAYYGDESARETVRLAAGEKHLAIAEQVYWYHSTFAPLVVAFWTLPLIMIVAYRGTHDELLRTQVMNSLSLCALDESHFNQRVDEYEQCNSLYSLVFPALVNLVLQTGIWQVALLTYAPIAALLAHPEASFTLTALLPNMAAGISLLGWAVLGAYFYGLTLMLRRWMLSDLTAKVLWKINTRLTLTFILGLLLMALASEPGWNPVPLEPYLAALAFLIGITPDAFLRWVTQQIKRLGGIDATQAQLFAPSDLQQKIDGLSFWQVDRLGEEGIESIQDLARKEIPSLLIRTRFDPALLLHWVDRALLCAQVDQDLALFKQAHVYTATDLTALAEREGGVAELLASIGDASRTQPGAGDPAAPPARISAAMIHNILSGLAGGPNLYHLKSYRANVSRPVADQAPDATPTAVALAPGSAQ